MDVGPGFQKRLGIRIGANLDTVGIQQGRQTFTDCLVRVYDVNYKLIRLHESILERVLFFFRVSSELRPQWYLGCPVGICGHYAPDD